MKIHLSPDWSSDIRHVFGVERKLSLPAKAVLVLLRATDNHALTAPQPQMSRWLSIGVKSLRDALTELEGLELIRKVSNSNRWGSTSASTYHLSLEPKKSPIWEAEG